ncbi:hypothetical protein SEA_TDANISKY_88 [Mycobacterium phage TDanisky]|uniref:Uncharacterized protein n=2 Tax=Cheoctovirus TaxID=1623281 RepID=A0A0S1S4V1_9CAUD|nr:hypothetical protein PBI_ESTAVE1_86 [Mycobacterium phage Estave1]YP_009187243.1 hypothetical protein SEA_SPARKDEHLILY_87 [Mycobacterium phage Sparkdehlily]AIM40476.1 hypothetical protein PBI_ESTAVE1_86 [Mycobacterium phage Estave1]ALM02236.1 hypothetical protein SEA_SPARKDEHLILY_87 [Mycobacterium phage Sparkdehlily]QGH71495.1 hypothetical protein SEA_TDANISKY_88 [Mycobacterium phage TDanisky]
MSSEAQNVIAEVVRAHPAGVQATRAADLTFDEAQRVLAIFDGPDA